MLPRRASSANVCFRCQLRLSKSPTSSLPFSPPTGLQPKSKPLKRPQHDQQRQFSSSQSRCFKIRTVSSPMSPKQKANLKQQQELGENQIGVYGRPGRQVLGEAIPLNIERLGAPSDVIVVRDGQAWSVDHVPRHRAPTLRPIEDQEVDILAAVKAETGLVMQSDVNANIEELRPQGSNKILTESEFKRIGKIIEKGFTNSQLQAYIRAYLRKEAEEGGAQKVSDPLEEYKKSKSGSVGNGLISKTDWYPSTTERDQPFEKRPLRGYLTIQHNTKQRLVLDILRTCWKCEVKEVLESIGELEMQINEPEFNVLTHPGISPLKPILAKLYHDDGERIDAYKSRLVLRITANRKRALKIADEIKSILDRIQKITIKLAALKQFKSNQSVHNKENENLIDEASETDVFNLMRAEVAKMTVTSIYCTRNLATIFGVSDSPNLQFASPAEIAKRLVVSYYTHYKNGIPRMGLRTADPSAPEALVRYDNLDSLPWYDRLRQWVRRTTASSKSSRSKAEKDSIVRETSTSTVLSSDEATVQAENTESNIELSSPAPVEAIDQRPGNARGGDIWCENYRTESDVMLGQVLHEKPGALPIKPLRDREKVRISKNQTFSTRVPNLPTLMESWRVNSGGLPPTISESVTWQFEPSPLTAHGLEISQAFPPIEMEFGIADIDSMTRTLYFKEAKAFVQTTTSDVMLPDRPVDLRFQQRTTSRLLNSLETDVEESESSAVSRISKYLGTSELNLVTGIKTPSSLMLPMARHLCNDEGIWKTICGDQKKRKRRRGAAATEDAKTKEPAGFADVEYIFTGMEIRKRIQFDFKGWSLVYTDISAGKAGGRRREVRLCPETIGSEPRSEKDFIRAAFELADVVGGQESRDEGTANIKWHTTEASGHSEYFDKEVIPGVRHEELGINEEVD